MNDDHWRVANDVVAELEAAHAAEDVARYVVMPGGLARGSVEYRPSSPAAVGQRGVIVVVDQVYRAQDGNDAGTPTILAGQNTTVADPA